MKNIKTKFLSLLTAVFVLLPSIAVPVFAEVYDNDLFFPDVADSSGNLVNGSVIGANGSITYSTAFGSAYYQAIGDTKYAAGFYYSGDNIVLRICVFGNVTSSSTNARVYQTNNGTTTSLSTLTTGSGTLTLSDNTTLSVKFLGPTASTGYTMPSGFTTDYTIFGDFDALKAAFVDYYEHGIQPSVYNRSDVEILPGYVAYVEALPRTSTDILLKCKMLEPSTLSPLHSPFYWSNQSYMFVSSLPDSNTTFPKPGSTDIDWDKDTSYPLSILRQTNYAVASLTLETGAAGVPYLMIYNPLYYIPVTTSGGYPAVMTDKATNGSIFLYNLRPGTRVHLYPLSQTLVTDTWLENGSEVMTVPSKPDSEHVYSAVASDDGGSIIPVDSSGNVPDYGGDTAPPVETTIQSTLDRIVSTLDGFVDKFVQLMTAPISHISNLISAGSDFMLRLHGLYAWLPSEVSGVIISALVVVVVIGVFKVLL